MSPRELIERVKALLAELGPQDWKRIARQGRYPYRLVDQFGRVLPGQRHSDVADAMARLGYGDVR